MARISLVQVQWPLSFGRESPSLSQRPKGRRGLRRCSGLNNSKIQTEEITRMRSMRNCIGYPRSSYPTHSESCRGDDLLIFFLYICWDSSSSLLHWGSWLIKYQRMSLLFEYMSAKQLDLHLLPCVGTEGKRKWRGGKKKKLGKKRMTNWNASGNVHYLPPLTLVLDPKKLY